MYFICDFQLTEKLAQAESDLELAHRCKEEMQVEMEAKVAARGAGEIKLLLFFSFVLLKMCDPNFLYKPQYCRENISIENWKAVARGIYLRGGFY